MKKIILLILIFCLAIIVCGCDKHDEIKSPVNFYYCTDPINYNSHEGVISSEIRDQSQYNDLLSLLNLYVKGPKSEGLRSPFPAGIQVINIKTEESKAVICMNDTFSQLTGYDLTLACVCLSKTAMALTNLPTIRIMAETQPLDANEYIELTDQDFVFFDNFVPETTP